MQNDYSWIPDPTVTIENVTENNAQDTDASASRTESQQTQSIAEENNNETVQQRRYPLRTRTPPEPYWVANVMLEEPKTFQDAITSPQSDDWKMALDEEIRSLSEQNVYKVVQQSPDVNPLPCKWVFKIKYDRNGNIQRFKARLVAKGYKQISGIDFHETFSPVAKQSTLRLLLTLAAAKDLEIRNIDIKTAFLNGELEEEIFMEMCKKRCVA